MRFSVTELLLILAIVLLVFGTKKLRNVGSDLGGAIKNFRNAMRDGEQETPAKPTPAAQPENEPNKLENKGTVIEGQATHEKDRA